MNDHLSADTTFALMQAAQTEAGTIGKALKNTSRAKEMARTEEAAKEFEAMFVSEMMKPMFEGLETDGMFGGGQAEEVFRSLLLKEYGNLIAQTGSVGVAQDVKQEMIKMQEEADHAQRTTR